MRLGFLGALAELFSRFEQRVRAAMRRRARQRAAARLSSTVGVHVERTGLSRGTCMCWRRWPCVYAEKPVVLGFEKDPEITKAIEEYHRNRNRK